MQRWGLTSQRASLSPPLFSYCFFHSASMAHVSMLLPATGRHSCGDWDFLQQRYRQFRTVVKTSSFLIPVWKKVGPAVVSWFLSCPSRPIPPYFLIVVPGGSTYSMLLQYIQQFYEYLIPCIKSLAAWNGWSAFCSLQLYANHSEQRVGFHKTEKIIAI